MGSLFSALLPAAFMVPMIILACFAIHDGGLANGELALAAGIIVLTAGTWFYLIAFSLLIHTSFYAAGPTGAAIPPTGMQLRGNTQFVTKETEEGVMINQGPEMTGVTVVQQPGATTTATTMTTAAAPYEKTSTYATESEPAVNPRTGDVGRINHTSEVDQTTLVNPPPVATQPVVYETVTGTSYQTVPTTIQSQEIRYHDY
jgi:hypothetical protein